MRGRYDIVASALTVLEHAKNHLSASCLDGLTDTWLTPETMDAITLLYAAQNQVKHAAAHGMRK